MSIAVREQSLFGDFGPRQPRLPSFPPGFRYQLGFLTSQEEGELIAGIGTLELRNSQYHEYTARRRTAGFGLRWSYDTASLHEAPPAPEFLTEFTEKVAEFLCLDPRLFPHVLVTEYPPGAPIGWDRDAPPFAVKQIGPGVYAAIGGPGVDESQCHGSLQR